MFHNCGWKVVGSVSARIDAASRQPATPHSKSYLATVVGYVSKDVRRETCHRQLTFFCKKPAFGVTGSEEQETRFHEEGALKLGDCLSHRQSVPTISYGTRSALIYCGTYLACIKASKRSDAVSAVTAEPKTNRISVGCGVAPSSLFVLDIQQLLVCSSIGGDACSRVMVVCQAVKILVKGLFAASTGIGSSPTPTGWLTGAFIIITNHDAGMLWPLPGTSTEPMAMTRSVVCSCRSAYNSTNSAERNATSFSRGLQNARLSNTPTYR